EDSYACISKLEIAYYLGQYELALQWAQRGKALEQPFDWMLNRKLRLFKALSAAALHTDAVPSRQKEIVRSIRATLRKMKRWKGHWGRHSSAFLLLQAEQCRIEGRSTQVVARAYEAAISLAREESYAIIEAIALERAYDY